jgi:hypothetical protein
MTEFFKTMMGRKFFEGSVPRIARALEDIGNELKRANDLKEAEKPETMKDVLSDFTTTKGE